MKRDGIVIFLFLAILGLVFGEVLFGGKVFCQQDVAGQFQPWKTIAREELIKGELPLWNPYSYCGMPLMANLQAGIFYPLGVFFYLFPFVFAFKTFVVLHFWLAAIFMYLLLRKWGISLLASLPGAIVFSLSPWTFTRIHFLSVLGTVIWLPLLFLVSTGAQEHKSTRAQEHTFFLTPYTIHHTPVLLGIVFATAFLSGHPQYLLYGIGLMLILEILISRTFRSLVTGHWSLILLGGIAALLIGAIQLISSGEFIRFSIRGEGITFADSAIWSFPPTYLSGLVFPFLHGLPDAWTGKEEFWVTICYVGIIPLLLGGLGFITSEAKQRKILAGILGIIFIFSFGKYTPVYWLLWKGIVPLRIIRYPATGMYLLIFLWAILTGLGSEFVSKKCKVSSVSRLGYSVIARESGKMTDDRGNLFFLTRLLRSFESLAMTKGVMISRVRSISTAVKMVIIGLIIIDLWRVDAKMLPVVNNVVFQYKGSKVSLFKVTGGYGRFFHTPKTSWKRFAHGKGVSRAWEDFRDNLYSNVGIQYRLFNIAGQDVRLKRYDEFLTWIEEQGSAQGAGKLCGLLGMKYLLSLNKIDSQDYRLVIDGKVKLYKRINRLPRVWVVPEAIYLREEEILDWLNQDAFSPREEIILEK